MDTPLHPLMEAGALAMALISASIFLPHTVLLSAIQVFCLLYATHRLAPRLAPNHALVPGLLITLGTLIGLQSVLQVLAYYANLPLTLTTDIGTQTLSTLISYLIAQRIEESPSPSSQQEGPSRPTTTPLSFLIQYGSLFLPAIVGVFFALYHADRVATINAIRTPWELLPKGMITAFLLIIGSGWLAAWRRYSSTLVWSLISLFFVTLALITPLVYPLGFGFDGFLHRASEKLLLTTGTLNPKPLYYMGQYVFTTWLTRTLSLPLPHVDLFLLAGSLLLLPATLARKKITTSYDAALLVGLPLLIPLKPWISTTPQSFAYLTGLSGLFLAYDEEQNAFLPALILGAWSAVIHPLAGLPLLGAIMLCGWHQYIHPRPWIKKLGALIISFGTALVVPLAFFIIRGGNTTQASWHLEQLFSNNQLTTLWQLLQTPAVRLSLWADWSAFIDFLSPFALALLAFIGAWNTKKTSARTLTLTAILLITATYLMQQITTFTFLIDYERQDYTQRLFIVGQLLLLPAALHGLAILWKNIRQQPALSLYGFLVFLAAWQGARLYRAFPYHDATHIEHGWNVSRNDQEAVRWIERDSQGAPYTVLANQAVSAAAVEELGFKRYAEELFFYPIPTGGPLYQVFLRAASLQATQEDIKTAGNLGKSSLVYLVLNKYWWQADQVADVLAPLAQSMYELDKGAIRIYKFDVNKDKKR